MTSAFPSDEEEFERSIVVMRKRLEEAVFDDKHRLKPDMFLSAEMLAYRLADGWYKRINAFEDLYSVIDRELYDAVLGTCNPDCDPENKAYYQVTMLEKMIPDTLNDAQWKAYCFVEAAIAVALAKASVDKSLSEDERTLYADTFARWSNLFENTPYNKDDFFFTLCDLMGFLDENQSHATILKADILSMLAEHDSDRALFAFLAEEE